MTVPSLTLWYEGREVGRLDRVGTADTDLGLTYHPDWQADPRSFPVSILFPLDKTRHEGKPVFFWFMNLLPEGQTLELVGKLLLTSELDVLSLMERMGGDLPGALVVRRTGEPFMPRPHRFHRWSAAELADAMRRLPKRPLLAGEEGVEMSMAGQQDKLPVLQLPDGSLALPLDGHPSTHVLKPRSEKLAASVDNEAYCMRLARACRIATAEVTVGRAQDIDYLLVRRYDRVVGQDGAIRRLHQEDLCQALGYPPFQKYEWNQRLQGRGPGVADLFRAVTVGPRQALNRAALLDMLIFNILVCNVDAHAKNYSLLYNGRVPEMAPLYDVMCGDVYDGVTRNLSQKIAGKSRGGHIHARHWQRLAREVGLSAPGVLKRVDQLSSRVLEASGPVAAAMAAELPDSWMIAQMVPVIQERCRRMQANLRTSLDEAGGGAPEDAP
ncbi:type II toxin-antitoxin system HipA family toxin [Azospirillum thermophilum]|uniref:type II toxin-antitoxin system HipA family toxin n=1 Tax=Azospirillum thermophilum TaxID=2202148 RepID=UPI00143DA3C7|nr:type II toxin-antitoxin system HipA family toxin [Azospirillum thermophilum]